MSRRSRAAVLAAVALAVVVAVVVLVKGGHREEPARSAEPATRAPTGADTSVRAATVPDDVTFLDDLDRDGTLRLEGQVIDADDHAARAATVTLNTNPPRTITTEADGSFAFDHLVGRSYSLVAHAAGGFAGPVTARLTTSSEPVILRLRSGAAVEVRALAAVDGRPIDGATVELRALATIGGTTDHDGRVRLVGVGAGRYVAVAWAPGFAKSYQEVAVPIATATTQVVARIQLELQAGAPVAGRVLSPDGAPVAGARVRFSAMSGFVARADAVRDAVTTDVDGRFRFDALPRGTFRFLATHTTYAPGSSSPITLDGTSERNDVEIRLAAGAVLAGRVVTKDGKPAPSATIRITARTNGAAYDAPRQTYADADGHFEMTGLPRREMLVVALHESASSDIVPVDLAKTPEQRDVVIVLDQDGAIAGVVVDQNGKPVDGAAVWAALTVGTGDMKFQRQLRGYSQELSDAGGRFAIHGLRPGSYKLYASRNGGATPGDVRLRKGTPASVGDTNVKIVLGEEGGVKGTVAFADGTSPGLFAIGIGKGAPVPFATSDGSFELNGLPAGELGLSIDGPSFDPITVPAKIDPGGVADVGTITVKKGRTLSGRVLDPNGTPVANASVLAGPRLFGDGTQAGAIDLNLPGARDSFVRQTTSGDDGSYSLHGIGNGDLALMAESDALGRSHIAMVPGSPDSSTIDLVLLPFASVAGTVTSGGQPMPEAVVTASSQAASTSSFVVSTGADGTFRFDHLAPDTYKVSAVVGRSPKMGFRYTGTTVQAISGQTVNVTLVIADGVTLLVHVAPTGGKPLDRALVYVITGDQAATSARDVALAAGAAPGFTFTGAAITGQPATVQAVPAGHYTVCAVAIPNEVQGMSKAYAYVDREGASMPSVCAPLDVTADPPQQDVSLQVVVPPFVPDPGGPTPPSGQGGGAGGGSNGSGGSAGSGGSGSGSGSPTPLMSPVSRLTAPARVPDPGRDGEAGHHV
jgi:protocatechuate 3,4-dioxygenase beta subunit